MGRSALVSLGLLACLAVSPAAAQDDAATARQHFDAGVQHFQAGEFRDALDSFRDAYRVRPHPAVLVNIANCYMELDRPVDAAASFERYLREATDIDPERRAEVERALGQARAAISTIDVVGPGGIAVFIDGDSHGRTPLRRPAEVNPGPHVIELRRGDGAVRSERVTLERGQSLTVPVNPGEAATVADRGGESGARLQEPTRTTVPSDRVNAETGEQSVAVADADTGAGTGGAIPIATWIAGGVGVAALVLGIAFGAAALSQQSEFEDIARDIQSRPPGDPDIPFLQEEGRSVADAQATNALVADLMFVTAAVAAGVAVVFLVTADDDTNQPGVAAGVGASPDGASLALAGRF